MTDATGTKRRIPAKKQNAQRFVQWHAIETVFGCSRIGGSWNSCAGLVTEEAHPFCPPDAGN